MGGAFMSDRSRTQDNAPAEADLTIEPSAEMAQALREATAALDAREAAGSGSSGGPAASTADKLTIELLSQELQDLKRFHEEKVQEFAEQKDHFLRLQAEFENFRRRSLKEKQESLRFGHQNLVKDLLSAVDNLERAMEHGAQNAGAEVRGVLDGIALVHREILSAFEKHGVSQLDAAGQIFDPAVHEAIGQIPNSEVPANTVVQVLQKGYVIHDRMVRPSRVLVSREPTPEERGSRRGD
jgi:molecular chaperone GrpE